MHMLALSSVVGATATAGPHAATENDDEDNDETAEATACCHVPSIIPPVIIIVVRIPVYIVLKTIFTVAVLWGGSCVEPCTSILRVHNAPCLNDSFAVQTSTTALSYCTGNSGGACFLAVTMNRNDHCSLCSGQSIWAVLTLRRQHDEKNLPIALFICLSYLE